MRFLACFLLALLGMGTARADPPSFYLGAGITYDSVGNFILKANPENTRGYPDIGATSEKVLIGFRPLPWLGFEANVYGTASTSGNFGDKSEVQAVAGYAVFLMPSEHLDLLLKGGISSYTLKAAAGTGSGESDSGAAPAAGAGLQVRYSHLGVRLEYEILPSLGQTHGLQVASLSVMLTLP